MYLQLVGSGYQITLFEEIKNAPMLLGNKKRWRQYLVEAAKKL